MMQTTFSFLYNSSRKKPNCFSEPVYRGAPGTAASAKPAEWWRSAQWHEAMARGTPRAQGRASPSGSNLSSPLLSGSSNSTQIKLLKNFFPLGAGGDQKGKMWKRNQNIRLWTYFNYIPLEALLLSWMFCLFVCFAFFFWCIFCLN